MTDLGNWNYFAQRRLRHHPQTSPNVSGRISNNLSLLEMCAPTHPRLPSCTQNTGTSKTSPTLSVCGEREAQKGVGGWLTQSDTDHEKLCSEAECPESQPRYVWLVSNLVGHQLRGAGPGSDVLL